MGILLLVAFYGNYEKFLHLREKASTCRATKASKRTVLACSIISVFEFTDPLLVTDCPIFFACCNQLHF